MKKVLMSVPVRKPDKSWFVRVHDQDDYRLLTAVIELKEDRETYLVAPDLWPALATEATFGPRAFYTAINRQGVVLLWQIRLPGSDGKLDDWNKTALEAAKRATAGWVRVAANMALGAYDVFEAAGSLTRVFAVRMSPAAKKRHFEQLKSPSPRIRRIPTRHVAVSFCVIVRNQQESHHVRYRYPLPRVPQAVHR